ncbi:hypothetical protein ACFQVC_28910 [Streptomyces monticola]|uniref:Uncharacterized protein n=1 Tax=Streptomyces monticola TaxID=2666263 RepID=A0ABW2JS46_9ACTN
MTGETLHGRTREELERALYRLWHHESRRPQAERTLLSRALVYLRRSGRFLHLPREHQEHGAAEQPFLTASACAPVYRAALSVGSRVQLSGEPHTGTVVHLVIGQDDEDVFPAAWYVVAVDALGRCRAHGSDEIEPAEATSGRRREAATPTPLRRLEAWRDDSAARRLGVRGPC